MSALSDFRQQYPQYSDMDDDTLLSSFHKKYYSDIPMEDFRARMLATPEPPPEQRGDPKKTNIFRDVLGAGISGVGALVEFPGQVSGLATGDFDNMSTRGGKAIRDFGQEIKSEGLQERERLIREQIQQAEAEGFGDEVVTTLKEYLSDPRALMSVTIEQLPSMALTLAAGALTGGGASVALGAGRLAAKKVTDEAIKAATRRASVAGAIGTGAAMQGASVGDETYKDVMNLPDATFQADPRYQALLESGLDDQAARESLAVEAARLAAAGAAAVSGVTAKLLPGIEKGVFGKAGTGPLRSRVASGAAGEFTQEAPEEGGGKFMQNVGVQRVDKERRLMQGVGSAATLGGMIGGIAGGGVGAARSPGPTERELREAEDARLLGGLRGLNDAQPPQAPTLSLGTDIPAQFETPYGILDGEQLMEFARNNTDTFPALRPILDMEAGNTRDGGFFTEGQRLNMIAEMLNTRPEGNTEPRNEEVERRQGIRQQIGNIADRIGEDPIALVTSTLPGVTPQMVNSAEPDAIERMVAAAQKKRAAETATRPPLMTDFDASQAEGIASPTSRPNPPADTSVSRGEFENTVMPVQPTTTEIAAQRPPTPAQIRQANSTQAKSNVLADNIEAMRQNRQQLLENPTLIDLRRRADLGNITPQETRQLRTMETRIEQLGARIQTTMTNAAELSRRAGLGSQSASGTSDRPFAGFEEGRDAPAMGGDAGRIPQPGESQGQFFERIAREKASADQDAAWQRILNEWEARTSAREEAERDQADAARAESTYTETANDPGAPDNNNFWTADDAGMMVNAGKIVAFGNKKAAAQWMAKNNQAAYWDMVMARANSDMTYLRARPAYMQDRAAAADAAARAQRQPPPGSPAGIGGPQFSAMSMGQSQPAQAPPVRTTDADLEQQRERAWKIVNERLDNIRSIGRQGRLAAADLTAAIKTANLTPEQGVAAFRIAEQVVKYIGGDKMVQFDFAKELPKINVNGKEIEPQALVKQLTQTPRGIEAVMQFSLSPSAMPVRGMTAPHEAFHVLQSLYKGSEPKIDRILASAFPEGKTIDGIDPVLLRKLKTTQNAKGVSYYDFLKSAIPTETRSSELQAYTFGALVDAKMSGAKMAGLTPSMLRMVNFLADMKQRIGAALRGDGITASGIMERAERGDYGALATAANVEGAQASVLQTPADDFRAQQTATPEFKRWFGDSKVVDDGGAPLTVFHGTRSGGFDTFRPKGKKGKQLGFGIHFATSPEFADQYASNPNVARKGKSPQVYETYLSIKNPLNADQIVKEGSVEFDLARKIAGRNFTPMKDENGVPSVYLQNAIDTSNAQRAEKMIRDAGFDGVRYNARLGSVTPGGRGAYVSARDISYIAFDPTQIKSATGNRGTFDPADPRIQYSALSDDPDLMAAREIVTGREPITPSAVQRILGALTGAEGTTRLRGGIEAPVQQTDALITNSINRAYPIHLLDILAKDQGKYNGKSAGLAMEVALNSTGRIGNFIDYGVATYDPATGNFDIDRDRPALRAALQGRVRADQMKDFQTYAVALRDRDLRKAGRVGMMNMTPAMIDSVIQKQEAANPKWKDAAADLNKMNEALLEYAVATGTLDRAGANRMKEMFYTPLYRQAEEDAQKNPGDVIGPRVNDSLRNIKTAFDVKQEGGDAPIGNMMENVIRNADMIMKAGAKNVAMKTAADMMVDVGLGKKVAADATGDNIISLRENGRVVKYQVDDAFLFQALAGMPREMQQGIYQTMARMGGFFRDMIVIAPPFIWANLWKGKVIAYVQEGSTMSPNRTISGLIDAWKGGEGATAIRAQTGFGGHDYGMGARNAAKAFEATLDGAPMTAKMWQKTVGFLIRASEASEFAERSALREKLIAEGMPEKEASFRAYTLAPFSRHGAGGGWLGSSISWLVPLVPFLNAKIQGMYRLVENEKRGPRVAGIPREIFLRGLVVTAVSTSLAMLAMSSEPEKWDKESPDLKLRYDIIYTPAGKILLPRAFEIGTIFGALPVFAIDAARKDHPGDLYKALGMTVASTFGFMPIPQAVLPMIQVAFNWDSFRGRELESKGDQSLPVEERINRSTTTGAKLLAGAVNETVGQLPKGIRTQLSPIQAQSLIEGYTGTMGANMLGAFDTLLGRMGLIKEKPAGAFGPASSAPAVIAVITGLSRFYRNDEQSVSRFVGDFYQIRELVQQTTTSFNRAKEAGDFDRLAELRDGKEGLPLRLRPMINAANTQVTELNKRIRMIERSNLSPSEMTARLVPLRQQRDRITQRVVERARELGI